MFRIKKEYLHTLGIGPAARNKKTARRTGSVSPAGAEEAVKDAGTLT